MVGNHNGQLAEFLSFERLKRLQDVAAARTRSMTVLLDRVHHAHNISAVMRSCDAFGVQDLHLIGESFDFSREISLGSENWLSLHRHASVDEAVQSLRREGYLLAILDARHEQARPVFELPFEQRLALVLGNEVEGVSPELVQQADLFARIPMFGFVESLNVSVSAAIALFCSTIAGATAARRSPLLPEGEQQTIVEEWMARSVRRSDLILKALEKRGVR